MIMTSKSGSIATIKLNRPEVKNAINPALIDLLSEELIKLKNDDSVRVIIITGNGNTFCSGADLNWLGDVANYTYQENYNESVKFINLLNLINTHPKPIIAKVNGSAIGGGVGIMLACDIIIANKNAKFGLSEVAIGIVPAAIIHFLINRIGETKARELLITGNRIDAIDAEKISLINYCLEEDLIDKKVKEFTNKITMNGPKAMTKVKEMIHTLPNLNELDTDDYIAKTIAELRISEEGQIGINAFLKKEKPNFK